MFYRKKENRVTVRSKDAHKQNGLNGLLMTVTVFNLHQFKHLWPIKSVFVSRRGYEFFNHFREGSQKVTIC